MCLRTGCYWCLSRHLVGQALTVQKNNWVKKVFCLFPKGGCRCELSQWSWRSAKVSNKRIFELVEPMLKMIKEWLYCLNVFIEIFKDLHVSFHSDFFPKIWCSSLINIITIIQNYFSMNKVFVWNRVGGCWWSSFGCSAILKLWLSNRPWHK